MLINTSNNQKDRYRKASKSFNVRFKREWPSEPGMGRVADELANRLDKSGAAE